MTHIPGIDYKAVLNVNNRIYPIATKPYKIQHGAHFMIIFTGFVKPPKLSCTQKTLFLYSEGRGMFLNLPGKRMICFFSLTAGGLVSFTQCNHLILAAIIFIISS